MKFLALIFLLASFTMAVNHYASLVYRSGGVEGPRFHAVLLVFHTFLTVTLGWLVLGGL